MPSFTDSAQEQNRAMAQYYRMQSKIYDATRWSFLFGRKEVLRTLPFARDEAFHLLEVGCGTGFNLKRLARRFPKAQLTGLDVSPDMVRLSRKQTRDYDERVQVLEQPYTPDGADWSGKLEAVLFSYSLTMINPQWQDLVRQAYTDLRPGGVVAVADFHDSAMPWFKAHMSHHHVRMDGHLLPVLEQRFEPLYSRVGKAYGGIWDYVVFVGRKG
jgi:S-adenosylmethionine-diacylgycerolhomoserine-N-methlytransferase